MAIRIRNKKLTAATIAALLSASLGVTLLKKAPDVETNFGVSSPSTRGFGAACDWSDFTKVPVLGFGGRTWNKGAAMPLRAVNKAVKVLDIWTPASFSGTYNCRTISGSSTYSHHAWAVAVDLDAAHNAMGVDPDNTTIGRHPEFVRQWTRFGFYWGGNFSRPDAMHFEYDGPRLPNRETRYPGERDAHNYLARALIAAGLPAVKDGMYDGRKEFTAVLAFQKKNGLVRIDKGGVVGSPTWTLLMLEARS